MLVGPKHGEFLWSMYSHSLKSCEISLLLQQFLCEGSQCANRIPSRYHPYQLCKSIGHIQYDTGKLSMQCFIKKIAIALSSTKKHTKTNYFSFKGWQEINLTRSQKKQNQALKNSSLHHISGSFLMPCQKKLHHLQKVSFPITPEKCVIGDGVNPMLVLTPA